MNKNVIKNIFTRQLVITVTTVFLLVIVIMGTSYALFMDVDTSVQENVFTSGDLVMVFNDKNGENTNTINNASLVPMSNEAALKRTDNIYSFTITNTGSLPLKYDVLLKDVEEFENENLLDHKYINYQLCIRKMDNCTIIRNLDSLEDGIVYQSNLNSGEQIIYYLRVWLTDKNIPNNIQEKEIHLEVNINAISASDSYLAYHLTDNGKVKQVNENNWYANDNNYIKFNNETWRIIGVFSKLNNGENIGTRVKIIKDEPLDTIYKFDETNNNYLESDLRKKLNTTYYDSLDENYKKLVEPVVINDVATNLFLINKIDIDNSKWLANVFNEYTMGTAKNNKVYAFNNGELEITNINEELKVRPVIFLSENTEYVSGNGTIEEPFVIK